MRTIFFFLFLIIMAAIVVSNLSCTTYKCRPSKGSKDYARRQWMNQDRNGHWVVVTQHGFKTPVKKVFECRPTDSILAKL